MIFGMSYSDFAAYLKEVRAEAGLSLANVSSIMKDIDLDLGPGRQWVHHLETGKRNLGIKRIELLCNALDRRLSLFALQEDEAAVKMSRGEAIIWEKVAQDEGQKEIILTIANKLASVDDSALRTFLSWVNLTVSAEMDAQQEELLCENQNTDKVFE